MSETLELKKETEMADEFLEHSEKQADDQEKQARELIKKIEREKMEQCGRDIDAILEKYGFAMDVQFSYDPVNGLNKMVLLVPGKK